MYKSQTSAPSHTHQCTSAFPATPKEPISRSFKAWRKHSLTSNPGPNLLVEKLFARSRYAIIQPAHLLCTSAMDYIPSSQPTPFLLSFSSSQALCNIPRRILHISPTPPNCLYKAVFGLGDRSLKSRESLINNRCVSPFVAHHETLVPLQPSRTSSNHNPS